MKEGRETSLYVFTVLLPLRSYRDPDCASLSRDARTTSTGTVSNTAWTCYSRPVTSKRRSRISMEREQDIQVVELRISYRYAQAHPWVVQAITGFLSAYFMEQPSFRVQRHFDELESGMHIWICEIPPAMKVLRLLKRLREDIPPCCVRHNEAVPPVRSQYVIDCPEADSSVA